jgi:hypothetical protein
VAFVWPGSDNRNVLIYAGRQTGTWCQAGSRKGYAIARDVEQDIARLYDCVIQLSGVVFGNE